MTEDVYSKNSEWYAALVAPWQDATDAAVRALLGPVDGGDVVDLGAGVGSCLPCLHDLGAGRLFAVEPSASMRVGLTATAARVPGLLERTTIVATEFPDALAELPPSWSGGVMLNAIGHLDDLARHRLWDALRERLVPGARFVVALQPPETVTSVPWTDFGTVRIGERRVRTRGQAAPLDATHVVWTMEWTLLDAHDRVLDIRTATYPWRASGRAELAAEAADRGLVTTDTAEHMFALEQPRAR